MYWCLVGMHEMDGARQGAKSLSVRRPPCACEDTKDQDDKNTPKKKGGMRGNTAGGILGFMVICKDRFATIHPWWECMIMMGHNLIP